MPEIRPCRAPAYAETRSRAALLMETVCQLDAHDFDNHLRRRGVLKCELL